MKQNTKALVYMAIIAPLLTEVLSGSTPILKLFNPVTVLVLFLSYSLPVLVLRELWLKWKLNLGGLFVLGLAYGILNEGILAKTFLLQNSVPVASFNNYGFYFGLNWFWLAVISVWHALYSVIFPILIIDYFFPQENKKRWLSDKKIRLFSAIVAVFAFVDYFFLFRTEKASIFFFVLFSSLIFYLIKLAQKYKNKINFSHKKISSLEKIFLGALVPVFFFTMFFLPVFINQFFYLIALIFFFKFGFKILKNGLVPESRVLFLIANYFVFALISLLIHIFFTGLRVEVIKDIIFLAIFFYFGIFVLKKSY